MPLLESVEQNKLSKTRNTKTLQNQGHEYEPADPARIFLILSVRRNSMFSQDCLGLRQSGFLLGLIVGDGSLDGILCKHGAVKFDRGQIQVTSNVCILDF